MDFGKALELMKQGKTTTRVSWNDKVFVRAQIPDDNSKMTKPYLYMMKGEDKFPLDLSCESIFATDWEVVD